jgi:hypothetical protein
MHMLPAGWYDDPHWPGGRRYFDGRAWTNHDSSLAPGSSSLVGAVGHGGLQAPEPRTGMATGLKVALWVLGIGLTVLFGLVLVWVATGFGQDVSAASTTPAPSSLRRVPA